MSRSRSPMRSRSHSAGSNGDAYAYHMEVDAREGAGNGGREDRREERRGEREREGRRNERDREERRDGRRGERGPDEGADTRACWLREMSRPKSVKDEQGRPMGFGSWYNRRPGIYSQAEFLAEQGHEDRVRTADCNAADRVEREDAEMDSGLDSDWLDRTSIDPMAYRAHRRAERDAKEQRAASTKKRRY